MENLALILVTALFSASIFLNFFLFTKCKALKKERPESVELKEFLADLLAGPAIVSVGRVDPQAILLRSPKR